MTIENGPAWSRFDAGFQMPLHVASEPSHDTLLLDAPGVVQRAAEVSDSRLNLPVLKQLAEPRLVTGLQLRPGLDQ
jgi:hypothetical protein